jgi:hypothetical protein
MAKQRATHRSTHSEMPEHPGGSSATSVPPRPSAIVRTDARREILDEDALEAPSLPRPPAAPRVSHWLRLGESQREPNEPSGSLNSLTEVPRPGSKIAWAVASLVVGFGGGLLVAWLVGFV